MKFLSLLNKTCNFSSDTKLFHHKKESEENNYSEYISVAVFQFRKFRMDCTDNI